MGARWHAQARIARVREHGCMHHELLGPVMGWVPGCVTTLTVPLGVYILEWIYARVTDGCGAYKHPTKAIHRLIENYVEVLTRCV